MLGICGSIRKPLIVTYQQSPCGPVIFYPFGLFRVSVLKLKVGPALTATWTFHFLPQLRGFSSTLWKHQLELLHNSLTGELRSSGTPTQSLFPRMPLLQSPSFRALHRPPVSSSFWGKDLSSSCRGTLRLVSGAKKEKLRYDGGNVRLTVIAIANGSSSLKMNLNEYMVTLDKPLGIRFALSVDGKIFVHAIKRGVFPPFSRF